MSATPLKPYLIAMHALVLGIHLKAWQVSRGAYLYNGRTAQRDWWSALCLKTAALRTGWCIAHSLSNGWCQSLWHAVATHHRKLASRLTWGPLLCWWVPGGPKVQAQGPPLPLRLGPLCCSGAGALVLASQLGLEWLAPLWMMCLVQLWRLASFRWVQVLLRRQRSLEPRWTLPAQQCWLWAPRCWRRALQWCRWWLLWMLHCCSVQQYWLAQKVHCCLVHL